MTRRLTVLLRLGRAPKVNCKQPVEMTVGEGMERLATVCSRGERRTSASHTLTFGFLDLQNHGS